MLTTLVLEERGKVVTAAIAHEQVIPISGRRLARYAGARLTLSDTAVVIAPNGARITGCCGMYDGTSIAITTEQAEGRDLVIAALGSGRFLRRLALSAGCARVAERRGIALVREDARRIPAFDLRIGRLLGRVVTSEDLGDLATDPDGSTLAIRLQGGQLDLSRLTDRRLRVEPGCDSGVFTRRENGAGSWTAFDQGQAGRVEGAPRALQPKMTVGVSGLSPRAPRRA